MRHYVASAKDTMIILSCNANAIIYATLSMFAHNSIRMKRKTNSTRRWAWIYLKMLLILLFQFICTWKTGSVCGKRERWNQHFSLQPRSMCMLQLGQQIMPPILENFLFKVASTYTPLQYLTSAWTCRYLFWHRDSCRKCVFFFLILKHVSAIIGP